MKKAMMMMVMVGVLGAGVGGAQTYEGDYGTYSLSGCYQTKDGVRCDFNYSAKEDKRLYWAAYLFQVVKTDGGNLKASKVSAGGSNWTTSTNSFDVYKGVPVKVSVLFDLPSNTNSLRILTVEGQRSDNIVVRNSAAPAPAPVTNSAPAPAPAQAINISGNWNATLTNCRQSAPGVVVCTATLKK